MPKILPIITNPNPALRKKSVEVDEKKILSPDFQKFCDDMILTMKEKDGIGLAAPQIDKQVRLIVINSKDGVICAINPRIIKKSLMKEWGEEGCLSVPNTFGQVKRHKKIKCVYFDKNNKKITTESGGLMARVFQHEIDHLDGILFIDKARDIKTIKEEKE